MERPYRKVSDSPIDHYPSQLCRNDRIVTCRRISDFVAILRFPCDLRSRLRFRIAIQSLRFQKHSYAFPCGFISPRMYPSVMCAIAAVKSALTNLRSPTCGITQRMHRLLKQNVLMQAASSRNVLKLKPGKLLLEQAEANALPAPVHRSIA